MANIITRTNAPTLLVENLHTAFANYNTYPDLWTHVFRKFKSDKAVEYEMEMRSLGLAELKQDAAPAFMSDMAQGYMTSYVNQFYAIGFQMSRGMIEDNLYQSEFPRQTEALRNSVDTLKNINAMYQFNHAFDNQSMVSDGKPLCSIAHPINTGTLQNTFTNGVGLNESAYEDAVTIIKGWKSLAGIQINTSAVKLLVPQALGFEASRLAKSEFRTATANNDISAIYHDKYMPGGYLINQFITNPNYWFILTDEQNGFKYFKRTDLDIDFITDINTDNVTVRAVERYAFGCSNWRAVFGSGVGVVSA